MRATTCEPPGETRPKCIPAKEPGPEAPLTHLIRRIKCRTSRRRLRAIPKWARITRKWEGSIRRWQAEVTALARPVGNRKARKSQANADPQTVSVRACNSTVGVEEGEPALILSGGV